jgi:PadR family transcriptional regulator PadR
MDYLENIQAQIKKGLLEYSILLIIKQKKVYASEIIEKLKDTDLIVVEGTLYPLLSRLRKHELVEYEWKESKSGPPRKYYKLTKKGREALVDLSKTWVGLSKSINTLIKKDEKSS